MDLTGRDFYLVLPQLLLAVLGLGVVLLDLAVRRKAVTQTVAVVGLIAPLVGGIALWDEVHAEGAQLAFHGALSVDAFSLYFTFLITGVLALVFLAGTSFTRRFAPYQAEFTGLVILSGTGLSLLASATDLITIYVSLELASLPVVALAAFARTDGRASEAGVKYLILSAVSSAVLLYGFAFLYGATGSLQLVPVEDGGPSIASLLVARDGELPFGDFAVLVGAVLAAAGFGFKLSMVPFHMWTPDVYEGAPTPVAAFLAVASKAAAFAVVLRLFYVALGPVAADWSVMFAGLAAVTMTIGNLMAVPQTNLKRLLGYSAIAHAGYMLVGVAAIAGRSQEAGDASLGISSTLFYLGGYAAMNLAAFFAVIAITNRTGDERVEGLAGMGRRSPLLALLLTVALLSLTGIPPTVGFMGKLFLFNAAINADLMWLALIGLVNSVISAYYYVNIIRTMYLREPGEPGRFGTGVPEAIALGVTSLAVLVLGLWPSGLLDVARTAALALLG